MIVKYNSYYSCVFKKGFYLFEVMLNLSNLKKGGENEKIFNVCKFIGGIRKSESSSNKDDLLYLISKKEKDHFINVILENENFEK